MEQFRTSDKERKAMEKLANQKLKQASKAIEAINGLNGQNQAIMDEFRELQQYYDESLQFNAEADSMSKGSLWTTIRMMPANKQWIIWTVCLDLWGTCLAVLGMNCFRMSTPFIIISISMSGTYRNR